MSSRKILSTKSYGLFHRNPENRPIDINKHKKLLESMKRYGFLTCFPIVVRREADGKLVIKDGQHRLEIAELLGLTVYWVEEEEDFDIAVINCTSKTWTLKDYAQKHAANGLKAYREGLDFAEAHSLPIGTAFALLAGTMSFNNCQDQFMRGDFRVKDRAWAESVANVYGPLSVMAPVLKSARFIEACMAACRVPEFDGKRLIANAERCREKLGSFSTRDAYLEMMEDVYNFGRKQLLGLKAAAVMALRGRNVAGKNPKASANGSAKVASPLPHA